MAQPFGRQRNYEYHKVFTAKAASLLQQRGIKVDWAVHDNGLFCTIFAGMRTNVCTLCSSDNHTSDFCSLVGKGLHNRAVAVFNAPQQGKRNFQTFQGVPLCINYNERLCTRPACVQNDIFLIQKSRCNNKIKTNMETKGADKKHNRKVENCSSSQ